MCPGLRRYKGGHALGLRAGGDVSRGEGGGAEQRRRRGEGTAERSGRLSAGTRGEILIRFRPARILSRAGF